MKREPGPQGRDLGALFDPGSVAVVGASDDPAKWGNWIARGALSGARRRSVHLVNRSARRVLGQPCHPSLRDLPGLVDLAVICVPAAGFEAAVDDALAVGARAIVGITAGLGELGPEGRRHQDGLVRRIRDGSAVLLGPNCLGVIDAAASLHLTCDPLPPGRVALISQSGNLSLELGAHLARHGHGFSRFVSLGNQADLEAADLLVACAEHEPTDAIALYCEDFRDGRRFARAAHHAARLGKPVVLLTVGGSEAAQRGARSHTGSLVSSSAVVDAVCAATGTHRVTSPAHMADVLAALLRAPLPVGDGRTAAGRDTVGSARAAAHGTGGGARVAVLADGGGHAAVACDVLDAHGLTVPPFGGQLAAELRTLLPPTAATGNPVDVAGGGEQDVNCFAEVADRVLASGEVDTLVLTGYFGGYHAYGPDVAAREREAAARMAASAAAHGRMLAVHSMFADSDAAEELRTGGVPVFSAIESLARGLGAATGGATAEARAATGVPEVPPPAPPVTDAGYWSARTLLAAAGVPFPPAALVRTGGELAAAAGQLRFPVVLKATGLLHKSDAGGVVLGLPDPAALTAAHEELTRRLGPRAVTVEEMADTADGVELIVGVRRDLRFGPIAVVGVGGIHTEVLADTRCALAPLGATAAEHLLRALRGAPLLTGSRNRPPVDLGAAARLIADITALAAAHPEIAELEVNPVLTTPYGATALDARIVLGTPAAGP